jgi:hypothetical protein
MPPKAFCFHNAGKPSGTVGIGTDADARAWLRHLNTHRTVDLYSVREVCVATKRPRDFDIAAALAMVAAKAY